MNKTALIAIGGIVIVLLTVVVLFFGTTNQNYDERISSFDDLGGDFTLLSNQGEQSLSDYQGKVVVMYFGFLTCPEVCPSSMQVIKQAINRLPKAQQQQTQALLISVDPQRDTPEKLAEYVKLYHHDIIGLTGTKQQIDNVTRQYGAYYNFTEIQNVTSEYGVEHSSRYYVINQSGKLVAAMRHSTTPNELHAQIVQLLK